MGTQFTNRPFDKLKKRIDRQEAQLPPPLPPIAVTEEDIFRSAMRDVEEITEFRLLPCTKASKHTALTRDRGDSEEDALGILLQISEGTHPINLSLTQEYVEWTNPTIRTGLAGELHKGRFSVQAMLDLHGCTGDRVNDEIDAFLRESFRRSW